MVIVLKKLMELSKMNEIDKLIMAKERRLQEIITILKTRYFIMGGKAQDFRKVVKN